MLGGGFRSKTAAGSLRFMVGAKQPNPIERSMSDQKPTPDSAEAMQARLKYHDDEIRRLSQAGGGPAQLGGVVAHSLIRHELASKGFNDAYQKQWERDFTQWLQGEGREEDHRRTMWGRQNLAQTNTIGVVDYLDQKLLSRTELLHLLDRMRTIAPTNLFEAYLYYKHVVRGEAIDDDSIQLYLNHNRTWRGGSRDGNRYLPASGDDDRHQGFLDRDHYAPSMWQERVHGSSAHQAQANARVEQMARSRIPDGLRTRPDGTEQPRFIGPRFPHEKDGDYYDERRLPANPVPQRAGAVLPIGGREGEGAADNPPPPPPPQNPPDGGGQGEQEAANGQDGLGPGRNVAEVDEIVENNAAGGELAAGAQGGGGAGDGDARIPESPVATPRTGQDQGTGTTVPDTFSPSSSPVVLASEDEDELFADAVDRELAAGSRITAGARAAASTAAVSSGSGPVASRTRSRTQAPRQDPAATVVERRGGTDEGRRVQAQAADATEPAAPARGRPGARSPLTEETFEDPRTPQARQADLRALEQEVGNRFNTRDAAVVEAVDFMQRNLPVPPALARTALNVLEAAQRASSQPNKGAGGRRKVLIRNLKNHVNEI